MRSRTDSPVNMSVCVIGDLGSNLTSDRVKASVALCVFLCLHLSFNLHVNVHVFQSLWHGSVSLCLCSELAWRGVWHHLWCFVISARLGEMLSLYDRYHHTVRKLRHNTSDTRLYRAGRKCYRTACGPEVVIVIIRAHESEVLVKASFYWIVQMVETFRFCFTISTTLELSTSQV